MRIGVLGGTFDPVHRGHLHLARQAQRKLSLDRVFFIPAYLPPHKEEKRHEISPAADRLAMLRQALAQDSSFKISLLELRKKRKVYTVETLARLRRRFPRKTEFFLLTGADNLEILDHWKDLKRIFSLCRFVVAARPGFQKRSAPGEILWLAMPPCRISSTAIRRRVREGQKVSHLLPPGIAALIRKRKLYQPKESS